jgi:hypothetical protein
LLIVLMYGLEGYMRKLFALILVFLWTTVMLVSCGISTDGSDYAVRGAVESEPRLDGAVRDEKNDDGPHSDRAPFQIVYMCDSFDNVWCKNIVTAMKTLQDEYNFTLISTDTDYDYDLWMSNVETYCDQAVDGFVLNCNETMTERTYEVTSEYEIPWLFESTAVRDIDGNLLTSGVELDACQVGMEIGLWIVDHYNDYFDVDQINQEKAGYISIYYSSVLNFNNRCASAEKVILSEFPDIQIFRPDLLVQGNLSADAAYNVVFSILRAHPEIEYWLITCIVDDWGFGSTRAVADMELEQSTLITSAGGELLVLEWDNGYDTDGKGCWKACCYYEAMDYVEYLIPGMIAILEGETTVEDIWNAWDEKGSVYASVKVGGTNCTRETYQSLIKMRY